MLTLQEQVEQFKTTPYAERVSMGRIAFKKMIEIIEKKGCFFVSSKTAASWYYFSFCGVDRKIKMDEHRYYNDITSDGLSYDEFYNECIEVDHPEISSVLRNFMRKLGGAEVGYFQMLAAYVYTLKQDVTYDEMVHLVRFFND